MTAYEQPTLGELRRKGQKMHGRCLECDRERALDPRQIALPDDMPVRDCGRHMRCKMCKGTLILVEPLVEEIPE